ncbi:MAG: sigma-70 family RNA polymerase sigma factor [Planctomycetota bacterium]
MPLETPLTAADVLVHQLEWLRGIVQSRIADRSRTDDVLQEVAVAAVKTRERFESVEDVKSWLYRVSIRQMALVERCEVRQRKKLKGLYESSPAMLQPDHLESMQGPDGPDLQKALAHLADRDRVLLKQRYQDRMSCADIAREQSVSESAIQSRLLRARRRLRSLLIRQIETSS